MSEHAKPAEQKPLNPERYTAIDELNRHSWYLDGDSQSQVIHVDSSIADAGAPRVMANKYNDSADIVDAAKAANRLMRHPLAGNMSTARDPNGDYYGPQDLPSEERPADARANMIRHLENLDIDPASVRILHPNRDYTTALAVVDVDHDPATYDGIEPAKLEGEGDMIYTYNPNIVLGVRPADCPLVVFNAETPKGEITIMVHFAWQGAAAQQVKDMQGELEKLEVDLSTAKIYMTPGGHSETFPYENYAADPRKKFPDTEGLFNDVEPHETDGKTKYNFTIDTPYFVYEGLLGMGLDPYQIFVDTSDTTAPESGYSSHSRQWRLDDTNTRDLVTVKIEKPKSLVASNPDRPTPPEIEWQIVPLEVEYIDFDGNLQQGTIEVNRDVYDDVKAFFEKALELKYPIEKVVKSSDTEYQWDDDKMMAANTSSGFNYRLIKDTDRPSLHGLGRAFDINTRLNPFIRHKDGVTAIDPPDGVYDPSLPGVLTTDHPLVLFMKERGWEWGGDWAKDVDEDGNYRIDYQHFQKKPPEIAS